MSGDSHLPPMDRLGTDAAHATLAFAAAFLVVPAAGYAVAAVMLARQPFDGWRSGHGRRADAWTDAAVIVAGTATTAAALNHLGLSLWMWLPAGPVAAALGVGTAVVTVAWRWWQQRGWR